MTTPPEAAAVETPAHQHPQPGRPLSEAQVGTAVGALAMLAEPTRLRLLWALRDQELGVTALAEAAGCSPTAASQHLSKLRISGLVDQRADGRARLYRLRGAHLRRLLDEVAAHADHTLLGIPPHG
ncbi:DNA-binding transcriptional ArsR family regulator [Streptacidiphilus sp. MAP12-20]|uniref:ArsR/SmtB family transcription factor n=1 Tax=Streptacidiphilus sp. MAP12-20 TaxID=3156299 RepID=UPI003517FE0B